MSRNPFSIAHRSRYDTDAHNRVTRSNAHETFHHAPLRHRLPTPNPLMVVRKNVSGTNARVPLLKENSRLKIKQ